MAEIAKVKYEERRIETMDHAALLYNTAKVIKSICVITGWILPADEEYVKELATELTKMLMEDYRDMNFPEIRYSFRKYGTVIKDWGRSMNLALIREVLDTYLTERNELSMVEQKMADKALPIPSVTNIDWGYIIEQEYQSFLSGRYNIHLWPNGMYDHCVECGFIHPDAFTGFIEQAQMNLADKLAHLKGEAIIAKRSGLAAEIQKSFEDIISDEDHSEVTRLAKKLAIELLFKQAKESNYRNLFIPAQ